MRQLLLHFLSWPIRVLARLTPDGFLFVALIVMCAALSVGANAWSNIPLLIALMLFALWALSLWRGSRAVGKVSLARRHLEHVFANEPLTVHLQVGNRARLPVAGLTIEEKVESEPAPLAEGEARSRREGNAPAALGRTFIVSLAGRETARAAYQITLHRRGAYQFALSRIQTVYPFGFFRSESLRRNRGRIVVYPRLGEVGADLFEDVEHALENMRRSSLSRAEESFRGLREYRRGDNPRWIHWRVSARAGALLVREFEEPLSKRVVLLLDTNLTRLGTRRFAAFENAVAFAGSAGREFARRGIEFDCVALQPGRLVRATVSRGRRNLDDLLELLALLKRHDGATLDDLRDVLPRRMLRGAFVLVAGLGSLRVRTSLRWIFANDNAVRVIDVLGEDFARIFRRATRSSVREQAADEDLLLSFEDEEEELRS